MEYSFLPEYFQEIYPIILIGIPADKLTERFVTIYANQELKILIFSRVGIKTVRGNECAPIPPPQRGGGISFDVNGQKYQSKRDDRPPIPPPHRGGGGTAAAVGEGKERSLAQPHQFLRWCLS